MLVNAAGVRKGDIVEYFGKQIILTENGHVMTNHSPIRFLKGIAVGAKGFYYIEYDARNFKIEQVKKSVRE